MENESPEVLAVPRGPGPNLGLTLNSGIWVVSIGLTKKEVASGQEALLSCQHPGRRSLPRGGSGGPAEGGESPLTWHFPACLLLARWH